MFLPTLVISAISIVADVVIKKAAVINSSKLLVLGMILYALDAIMWFWVYKSAKFSTVAIVYSLFVILLSVIIGFFFFHEKINTLEALGLVFGVCAIFLLARFTS